MDERQVVTYLVVVAAVLIVAIEGLTLLGLFGGLDGGGGTDAPTTSGTAVDRVGVDEEVLPETDRQETLSTASISAGDRWTLTLTVVVENTDAAPYELRLGQVTTTGGRRVDAGASTGRIAPNGTGTVTAQWTIPSGAEPDTVHVTALEFRDDEATVLVERTVALDRIPVQG